MRPQTWIALGALLAGTAVALGAFGAHGLDGMLATKYAGSPGKTVAGLELPASYKHLLDWKTAAEYQATHALAVVAVGLLTLAGRGGRLADTAGWCFVGGILLFSGSLYLLTLAGTTWLGAVTPLGGLLFLTGWGLLAVAALRNDPKPAVAVGQERTAERPSSS